MLVILINDSEKEKNIAKYSRYWGLFGKNCSKKRINL